jgi:hypothetical protein
VARTISSASCVCREPGRILESPAPRASESPERGPEAFGSAAAVLPGSPSAVRPESETSVAERWLWPRRSTRRVEARAGLDPRGGRDFPSWAVDEGEKPAEGRDPAGGGEPRGGGGPAGGCGAGDGGEGAGGGGETGSVTGGGRGGGGVGSDGSVIVGVVTGSVGTVIVGTLGRSIAPTPGPAATAAPTPARASTAHTTTRRNVPPNRTSVIEPISKATGFCLRRPPGEEE